jgi:hypothetical protein
MIGLLALFGNRYDYLAIMTQSMRELDEQNPNFVPDTDGFCL